MSIIRGVHLLHLADMCPLAANANCLFIRQLDPRIGFRHLIASPLSSYSDERVRQIWEKLDLHPRMVEYIELIIVRDMISLRIFENVMPISVSMLILYSKGILVVTVGYGIDVIGL